jgi:colicin import membrane protein
MELALSRALSDHEGALAEARAAADAAADDAAAARAEAAGAREQARQEAAAAGAEAAAGAAAAVAAAAREVQSLRAQGASSSVVHCAALPSLADCDAIRAVPPAVQSRRWKRHS